MGDVPPAFTNQQPHVNTLTNPNPAQGGQRLLCSPQDVRDELLGFDVDPVPLDEDNPWLLRMIGKHSRAAEQECNRIFEAADYVNDAYDGSGWDSAILLRNLPIVSWARIQAFNLQYNYSRVYTPADEGKTLVWDYQRGLVEIIPNVLDQFLNIDSYGQYSGVWPRGIRNIRITYRAGFEVLPVKLVEAIAMRVAAEVLRRKAGIMSNGLSSFSANGTSLSFNKSYADQIQMFEDQASEAIAFYQRSGTLGRV